MNKKHNFGFHPKVNLSLNALPTIPTFKRPPMPNNSGFERGGLNQELFGRVQLCDLEE